jgi:hypothetical protein
MGGGFIHNGHNRWKTAAFREKVSSSTLYKHARFYPLNVSLGFSLNVARIFNVKERGLL